MSFLPNTTILLPDGKLLPIDQIQAGQSVVTHENKSRKAIVVDSHDYTGDLVTLTFSSHTVTMTAEQLVRVPNSYPSAALNWKRSSHLKAGDRVFTRTVNPDGVKGGIAEIGAVKSDHWDKVTVWALASIQEDGSYVAGGMVVRE